MRTKIITTIIIFLGSYLFAEEAYGDFNSNHSNAPSISIESKYGKGTKIHSITNVEQGDYYYNENIMDINFNFNSGIYLYTQLEYSSPPLKGFNFVGMNNYHLEYSSDKYRIKIGDIYTLYGKGLSLNMFQDHLIDYDNSLRGIECNYYIDDYFTVFLLGGKKDFLFRTSVGEDVPNLGIENYAYMFGLEKVLDEVIFHYLYLNKESILNHDKYSSLRRYALPGALGNSSGNDTLITSEHNLSFDFSLFDADFYIETSDVDYSSLDKDDPDILKDYTGAKLYLSIYRDIFDFGITYEYKNYWMKNYLKTLSNPPIVYRESISTLASRNSHTMNWNDEVGHQFNVDRYINNMMTIEMNLSIASKHKASSDNFNLLDILSISEASYAGSPFRQFYLGSSGWFLNDKFYYKAGFDDFIQVKTAGISSQHTKALTFPTLFTFTMGENSITTYIEGQIKTEKRYNENEAGKYVLEQEAKYTSRYFSLTGNCKGKISLTLFYEDERASSYSRWIGYDATYSINPTTQLSFFIGDQKGGLVCANGVCAVQPDLNDGIKITFRTLF